MSIFDDILKQRYILNEDNFDTGKDEDDEDDENDEEEFSMDGGDEGGGDDTEGDAEGGDNDAGNEGGEGEGTDSNDTEEDDEEDNDSGDNDESDFDMNDEGGDEEANSEGEDTGGDAEDDDTEEDSGEGDEEEFSMDGGDEGGGDDTEGDAEGGDESEGSDPSASMTGDNDPGNKLKELEKSIFDQLSPQQQQAKVKELKNLYSDVYDKCNSIVDMVGAAEKEPVSAKVYDYIINTLVDLQKYIRDYLDIQFDSKTYIENMTELQKYLAILDTVNNVFAEFRRGNKQDDK